ncbi:TetR/AcrR family transcriptional regulator [Haliscomenobacter sp.]|uniref:TetR/AcrR family transcriptional regulator n=1 Tax=Haliscomenobacter sp. TaxID=2717303 RepID=UPI0035933405
MNATDTRERILGRMFQDIHKNGFQGLRADRVIADLGITKGALYHYFPSKDAIGLAVIAEIIEPSYLAFFRSLEQAKGHPIDLLKGHLQELSDKASPDDIYLGCPLNNLVQEMSPLNEDFRQRLKVVMDGMIHYSARALERGVAQGQVKSDTDCTAVASFMVAGMEGAYGVAKVLKSLNSFHRNIQQLLNYLELFRA